MKKSGFVYILSLWILLFFSFTTPRNPHLIVGSYKCVNNVKVTSYCGNEFNLSQWYFSSDEFTSHISLLKKNRECDIHLAYKIYENDEELVEEGFNYPVILFKNSERKNFMLVFTIRELKKTGMSLHYEENVSNENTKFIPVDILLERIAGPPENMD